ncbi:hypothetical protein J4408_02430 [Candidatus Pacearchaeota archaeon]|nr:hypothetical protein [Candidatus Pacearchaeota archaeon]
MDYLYHITGVSYQKISPTLSFREVEHSILYNRAGKLGIDVTGLILQENSSHPFRTGSVSVLGRSQRRKLDALIDGNINTVLLPLSMPGAINIRYTKYLSSQHFSVIQAMNAYAKAHSLFQSILHLRRIDKWLALDNLRKAGASFSLIKGALAQGPKT